MESEVAISANQSHEYVVCRSLYSSESLKREFRGSPPSPQSPGQKIENYVKNSCSASGLLRTFLGFFPVFRWFPRYKISENLVADILAGITVFVVQLPQGIAYSKIAGLSPMQGIYASCFPLLSYFLMSNSKHLSVGPTMTTSILLASIIHKHTSAVEKSLNQTVFHNTTEESVIPGVVNHDRNPTAVEITVVLTFVAGIYQLMLGLFQMDFLFVYISKPFVGGYVLGTVLKLAIQETASMMGIETSRHSGPFDTIYFLISFFQNITMVNWITTGLSICSLVVMFLVREYFSPYTQKKFKMPFPIELVIVIISTLASKYLKLSSKWNVKTVGLLESGIPVPSLPPLDLISRVPLDSFNVAIVSLCFSMTINNLFSSKYNEDIDNNKEFVALGFSNLVSSIFSGMVVGGALSRSLIQESVGGKTQIVGIVTFIFFILALLVLGDVLSDLPECVLSAVILISFKDCFKTVRDFSALWKSCKFDAMVWFVAVVATLGVDLTSGLWIGIGFNILVILYRTQRPKTYLLGIVQKTNIYVPLTEYEGCEEIPNVKIFRFVGSLLYSSIEHFASQLKEKTNIDVCTIAAKRAKEEKHKSGQCNGTNSADNNYGSCDIIVPVTADPGPKYVIIDCSAIGSVDTPGLTQITSIYTNYRGIQIELFLADCNDNVYATMERSNFFKKFPESNVFISIHDAVLSITKRC